MGRDRYVRARPRRPGHARLDLLRDSLAPRRPSNRNSRANFIPLHALRRLHERRDRQCQWRRRSRRMKTIAALAVKAVLAFLFALAIGTAAAQTQPSADASEHANEQKARAELDAMVQALGGAQWLALQNTYIEGRVSGFYQGKPTGAISNYYQWTTPTGEQRIELGKKDKHDDIEIFTGNDCWEITYRGKKALPKDICDDALRRKAHTIDV